MTTTGWAMVAAGALHAVLLSVAVLPFPSAAPPAPRVMQAWIVADAAAAAVPTSVVPATPPTSPVAASPRPEPQPELQPERQPAVPAQLAPVEFGAAAAAAHAEQAARHWPSSALDRAALPFSAPDETLLDGVAATGMPVRLRLYIEADGRVSAVQVLRASEFDREAAARLQQMFLATAFVPGRVDGRDVASFMDIEVVAPATLAKAPAVH